MAACPAFDPTGPYVTGLTGFVDCHVQALGEEGYRALGAGSTAGAVLTGLLTIYIALIGYRMILGTVPTVRDGVLAAVKIGFVFALALQWPAYQAVVYRLVIAAPDELSARILAPGGLGDAAGLTERIQTVYETLDAPPPAPDPVTTVAAPGPNGDGAAASPAPVPPPADTSLDPVSQRAGQTLLFAALAGLLAVRIAAALLLALGPLFIACLLFGALRGLFEGWVRALAGAALAAIAVTMVLVFELAILEPQVAALLQARDAGVPVALLPGQALATTSIFAVILIVTMLAAAWVAAGFRLPDGVQAAVNRMARAPGTAIPAIVPATPAARMMIAPRWPWPMRSRCKAGVTASAVRSPRRPRPIAPPPRVPP
jgi:type IV secretion system protein VirB6